MIVETFYRSMAALGRSAETIEAFACLLLRVIAKPQIGQEAAGQGIRVMKTDGYGPFLPLRVFYWMDDDTLYLLDIEVYA